MSKMIKKMLLTGLLLTAVVAPVQEVKALSDFNQKMVVVAGLCAGVVGMFAGLMNGSTIKESLFVGGTVGTFTYGEFHIFATGLEWLCSCFDHPSNPTIKQSLPNLHV